jgi:hypothetical protein
MKLIKQSLGKDERLDLMMEIFMLRRKVMSHARSGCNDCKRTIDDLHKMGIAHDLSELMSKYGDPGEITTRNNE